MVLLPYSQPFGVGHMTSKIDHNDHFDMELRAGL